MPRMTLGTGPAMTDEHAAATRVRKTLKVRYMSDLHNEFLDEPVSAVDPVGEDVVILAGDIDVGTKGILWAQRAFALRPVIYVLGNHEFYRHDWDRLIVEGRHAAAGSDVHLLEHDAVTIGGVRFLGCSLWTDFLLLGADRQRDAMAWAERGMYDYRIIGRRGRPLWASESAERNAQSVRWLEEQLATDVPTIVVTHHSPTPATCDPKYRGDPLSAGFYSKLEHLVRPPVLAWIHGHSHYCTRQEVNGIPVLVNAHGYPGEHLEPNFRWNASITVDPLRRHDTSEVEK